MKPYDALRNYPQPKPDIRTRYRAQMMSEGPGWPRGPVNVYRIEEDGSETVVTTYTRNYSMLKTFEPFAQKQGDTWHDYALISPDYTSLSVLDLESGEIIAEEQPEVVTKEQAAKSKFWKEGDVLPGFCPMEFYVPNWWDEYGEDYNIETLLQKYPEDGDERSVKFILSEIENMSYYEGQYGFYSGCVWGDDSSAKLQYVDLSRIKEGIVTTDDRFGYLQLPDKGDLKDHINVVGGFPRIAVSTVVYYDIDLKKMVGKDWGINKLNWEDTPS